MHRDRMLKIINVLKVMRCIAKIQILPSKCQLLKQLIRTTKLMCCNTPHHSGHIDEGRITTPSRYLGAANVIFCNTPHHFGHIDAACILSSSTVLKT